MIHNKGVDRNARGKTGGKDGTASHIQGMRQKPTSEITQKMIDAGVDALLSSFSEECISWRTPGLTHAVVQVYRAMAGLAERAHRKGDVK